MNERARAGTGPIEIAAEIAGRLGAELDVFVVRKLGVPRWPELAMGAIASGGATYSTSPSGRSSTPRDSAWR